MNYFDKVIFTQKEKLVFFGSVDEIEFKSNFSSLHNNDENNIIEKRKKI